MKRFLLKLGPLFAVGFFLLWGVPAYAAGSYTVQNGDSLFLIGQRYGVAVADIKSANGLSGDVIYSGQSLAIPGGTSTGTRHTVAAGDTLFLISQKYGISVASLKAANNLTSDVIYPGQNLNITARPTTVTVSRSFSRSEMDLLARAVYAEARGEVYEGQVAVAAVILNRVKSPLFPNTIPGVIYQHLAFSSVDDGQINLPANQTAVKAVQDALSGWDPTKGALYFWNPAKSQSKWIWTRTITYKIGSHVFGI